MLTSSSQGVKGVIADATSFESARRRTQRPKEHYAFAGYVTPADLDSRTPLNQSNSDPESGDEESFVRTWRKNRLAELRTVATTRKRSPSKRKYGRVETVDAAGYLDAVERVSSETIVVVTIFNDEVPIALLCLQ
jgi:hypothetical protein